MSECKYCENHEGCNHCCDEQEDSGVGQYGPAYPRSIHLSPASYVSIKALRNHRSFSKLDGRTLVVHVYGYPYVWAIEEILKRASNLKAIEVLPVMFEYVKEEALRLAAPRGVVFIQGFSAPELAWADDSDDVRPPQWAKHHVFFRNLKGHQKQLFEELLELKIRAGLMTARYFCLGDEPYKAMRALRAEFDIGWVHTFSMMVNGVIHYLNPDFPIGNRGLQFVREMRRTIERARKEKAVQSERTSRFQTSGLKEGVYLKGKQGRRSANAELLGVLFDCKDRGDLDRLAKIDKHAHDVLMERQGLATRDNPQPKTLQAVADMYDLSRERIRQLEARALGLLGIDPHNPSVPETCPLRQ